MSRAAPPAAASELDPRRVAAWVRRAIPFVGLGCLVALYMHFGWLRVPVGMDTVPTVPPGSVCVIRKWPSSVTPGSLVFVDVPGGGTVLSRVALVTVDGEVVVQHDAPDSRLPSSEDFGALPVERVRGIVLTTLLPEGDGSGRPVDLGDRIGPRRGDDAPADGPTDGPADGEGGARDDGGPERRESPR